MDIEKINKWIKDKSEQKDNSILFKIITHIKNMDKKKRRLLFCVIAFVISFYMASLAGQNTLVYAKRMERVYLLNPVAIIGGWFMSIQITVVITVILFALICYLGMYYSRLFKKNYVVDEERGVKVADDGAYGNAHWMTPKEKENALYMTQDAKNLKEDIFGMDEEGYLVARKHLRFTNDNVIILGPPGCGKSACILNNDILQVIRRGESAIAIDSKGGIYRDTVYAAEKAGYNIKVFNLKPDELENSDAVDFFTVFDNCSKKRYKGLASSLATTFMLNMKDENVKKDLWYTGAYNLLMAMILITKFNYELEESERTLGTMYMSLVEHNTVPALEAAYEYVSIDRKHPAYEAWKTFTGLRDVVKESVLGGLLTDLNFLSNDVAREIVSNNEIDFKAPGLEKCIYYVIIDDQDRSNNVLASLFVECCSQQLKNVADGPIGGPDSRLPVKVSFEIDEFKNVGKLPGMGEKLSTYRSRGMLIKLFIQDLSQLQQMYPNEEWRTLIADCTTMIVLKVGENATASYIEERLGSHTIIVDNIRMAEKASDPIHLHPNYMNSEGRGTRPLMFAAELMGQGERGLKDDELIVIMNGQAPLKLKKWMWTNHPLCKALHLTDLKRKRLAADHIPVWREAYEEREREELEYKNNMKAMEKQVLNLNMTNNKMMSIDLNNMGTGSKNGNTNVSAKRSGNTYAKSNSL